jgi:microcystin-dependent protein
MSDPFVAEIRVFGFNFPPRGWAFCAGQLLNISQNTALFSLLGTRYGGDGKSTFGLPNFQGNVAIGSGQGPGLQDFMQGDTGGSPTVTLLTNEMPQHTHPFNASAGDATSRQVNGQYPASGIGGIVAYSDQTSQLVPFDSRATGIVGNGNAHNNMQPYLALNYCLSLQGVYPPRT